MKADANPGLDNVVYVTTHRTADVQHPLRRALRRLARLHVRHRESFAGHFTSWITAARPSSPRRLSHSPRTRRRTSRTRKEGWMSAIAVPPVARPPLWRRLIGFNLLSGIVLGDHLATSSATGSESGDPWERTSTYYSADVGQNDIADPPRLLLRRGRASWSALGFANYPIRRMLGYPPTLRRARVRGGGASVATSASAPTTRSSRCSTSSGSAFSSSSAASTPC